MTQEDIIQTTLKDSNYHLSLFSEDELIALRKKIEAECPNFVNADLIAAGLVNEWALFDNSGKSPQLIEEGVNE